MEHSSRPLTSRADAKRRSHKGTDTRYHDWIRFELDLPNFARHTRQLPFVLHETLRATLSSELHADTYHRESPDGDRTIHRDETLLSDRASGWPGVDLSLSDRERMRLLPPVSPLSTIGS
ncbi:hypothetical protein MUK42_11977 [Musa troglodytarum]|uniref:Uncharacterized protein n=1 Tax=Musa troglodytarum TaxID=320322 RepID=A0A9E7JWW9_9LILI|nr:hypothetical protein MUK42_11977 [Musa troglodytarum]